MWAIVLQAGQIVARLDPLIQDNALRSAEANLASLQAVLTQARLTFWRQQELQKNGWTPRANFDEAQQILLTAEAHVHFAMPQLVSRGTAGLHGLVRRRPGAVTATGAEPGQSPAPGKWLCSSRVKAVATPSSMSPSNSSGMARADPRVEIALTNDLQVKATGRVREIAPQADFTTRTFQVKVGITDLPADMRLGATVVGRIRLTSPPGVEVPASALTRDRRTPSRVGGRSAEPRPGVAAEFVEVLRSDPAAIVICQGL